MPKPNEREIDPISSRIRMIVSGLNYGLERHKEHKNMGSRIKYNTSYMQVSEIKQKFARLLNELDQLSVICSKLGSDMTLQQFQNHCNEYSAHY